MGLFTRKNPLDAELEKVMRQEEKFLAKRKDKKESQLNQLLAEKVPENMQQKLDSAFAKAFELILKKGTGVIEMTYRKDQKEVDFLTREVTANMKENRKSMKAFSKDAGKTGAKNLAISGVSGVGMGILGIGIPDIPVFTGMILKQIYETAINYGYDYDTEQEQYFIMLLIQGSVSYGEKLEEIDELVNNYIRTEKRPEYIDTDKLINQTAGCLSKELLYMKFLQGIPFVGAIGGAYDAIYMKRIAEYSEMKYRRRFFEDRKKR